MGILELVPQPWWRNREDFYFSMCDTILVLCCCAWRVMAQVMAWSGQGGATLGKGTWVLFW